MLCPPSWFPAIKREIHTDNRSPFPCIPLASYPRIKGSQQYYNTGCIPPWAVVAGGVVAVAAADVAVTAVTAAVAVTVSIMLWSAAVVVAESPPLAAYFARGPSC